jgi:oligoendopeptidase F
MHDAAGVAQQFDIDITQPAFWRESLDLVAEDIDRFEHLVDAGA